MLRNKSNKDIDVLCTENNKILLGKVLKNPKEIKGHVYGLEDSQKC
jgi:hypothetical protein